MPFTHYSQRSRKNNTRNNAHVHNEHKATRLSADEALQLSADEALQFNAEKALQLNAEETSQNAPSFEGLGLSSEVLAAVANMGYIEPTPVQAQAIPYALEGRDVFAAAQTGTGKTAAFLLPAMNNLPHVPRVRARGREAAQGPLMLVLTPTRELAQQIEKVCCAVARQTGHTSVTVVGGVSYNPQRDKLKRGCDILIATPGRLQDLIDQGACSLDQVQVLVLDEADRMLDMGFLPAIRRIVRYTRTDRQTLLFSATLDEKQVGSITNLVSKDAAHVEIAPVTSTAETVEQYVLPVSAEAKNGLLTSVLKREGARRVIVFTRTKHRADSCSRRLAREGFTTAAIHGDRSQSQRERALKAFRSGACDVLVATDVLARGIDITDVRYVINFDVPTEPVDYIHRIGRTGRAGEEGWSLTFVTYDDIDEFFDIEALMGKTVEQFDAEGLELGAHPPVLKAGRVPAKAPAGKKEKKRRRKAKAKAAQRNSSKRSGRRNEHEDRPQNTERTPMSSREAWRNYDEPTERRGRGGRSVGFNGRSGERLGEHGNRGRNNERNTRQNVHARGGNGAAKNNASRSKNAPEQRTSRRRPGDRGGKR